MGWDGIFIFNGLKILEFCTLAPGEAVHEIWNVAVEAEIEIHQHLPGHTSYIYKYVLIN